MELCSLNNWARQLWITGGSSSPNLPSSASIKSINFRWENRDSWNNLPEECSVLVITIPPLLEKSEEEEIRLAEWCRWVQENRPRVERVVYVSSTGVYPNKPGNWSETSKFQTDSGKGALRLISENVLSQFFETRVVRSGAIYGKGRNIGERLLKGKWIPVGKQPIHRIHVQDLARIVQLAVLEEMFPPVLNAIDLEAETSRNVAIWLLNQPFFSDNKVDHTLLAEGVETRKFNRSEPDRGLDNTLLRDSLKFSFTFPTYREGLTHAFDVR